MLFGYALWREKANPAAFVLAAGSDIRGCPGLGVRAHLYQSWGKSVQYLTPFFAAHFVNQVLSAAKPK